MADDELEVRSAEVAVDPLTAYARLRSYTPGRGSFLFESRSPADAEADGDDGRYSIVGYRVRGGEMIPPGHDAISILGQRDEEEAPATFTEALALGTVGYVGGSSALMHHRVPLFEDEGAAGQFNVAAVVMVFDHHDGKVTVAGRKKGKQVERCLWELEHAPEVVTELPCDGRLPERLGPQLDDDKLIARAQRAAPFVDDELESLVLAQTFHVPLGESDPFDAYLAWRSSHAGRLGYFVDFGQSPMNPPMTVFGFGDRLLYSHRRGGDKRFADALHASLPSSDLVGSPTKLAAKLLRRLEDGARHVWGGSIGYMCPGGEAAMILLDDAVCAQAGAYWYSRPLRIVGDTACEALPELARSQAVDALSAIATAIGREGTPAAKS